jgi:hypothetical protein
MALKLLSNYLQNSVIDPGIAKKRRAADTRLGQNA